MATSLASQLQRLSTAQTALYQRQRTTKVSFLFDARKAAEFDIDTYHAIGQSGFKELVQMQPALQMHWRNLFSDAAKDYERAMQDAETNKRIDNELEQFVSKITPYFLIRPCHKVIEWLIQRFHIHTFNVDLLMRLALPYHHSNYFVRLVQVVDTDSTKDNHKWQWLAGVKKEGMPLTLGNIVDRCFADNRFFEFVCDMYHSITTSADDGVSNETQLKFTTAVFVNVVEQYAASLQRKSSAAAARKASKLQLVSLYRGLLPAVKSRSSAVLSSAYIILLRMHALMDLDEKLLSAVVSTLLSSSTALGMPETLVVVAVFLSKLARNATMTDKVSSSLTTLLHRIIDTDELVDALPKALRQPYATRPHIACLKWLAEAILFQLAELQLSNAVAGTNTNDIADDSVSQQRRNQFVGLINAIPYAASTIQRLLAVLMSKLPPTVSSDDAALVGNVGKMISVIHSACPEAWPEFIKSRMMSKPEAQQNVILYGRYGVELFEQLQSLQRIDTAYFGKLASIAIVSHQVAMVVKTEQLTDFVDAGKKSGDTWKAACIEQILSALRNTTEIDANVDESALAADLCRIMEKCSNDPSTATKILKQSSLIVQYAGEIQWKRALLQFFSSFFDQSVSPDFWRRIADSGKYDETADCVFDAVTALCMLKNKADINVGEIASGSDKILPEAHAVAVALLFSWPTTSNQRADVLQRLSKLPYFIWLRTPTISADETSEESVKKNLISSAQVTRLLCRRLLSCDKSYVDYVLSSLLQFVAEKSDKKFDVGDRFAFHAINIVSMVLVAQLQQQKRGLNFESLVVMLLKAVNGFVCRASADTLSRAPRNAAKSTDDIIDVAERKFIMARKITDEIFSGWAHAILCGLTMQNTTKKLPDYLAPLHSMSEDADGSRADSASSQNIAATTRHQHQQAIHQTYLLELCRFAFITLDSPRMSRLRAIFLALFAKRLGLLSAVGTSGRVSAVSNAILSISSAVAMMNNLLRCLLDDRERRRRNADGAKHPESAVINRALAFFVSVINQLDLPAIVAEDETTNKNTKSSAAISAAAAELENNLTVMLFLALPLIKSPAKTSDSENYIQASSVTAHLVVDMLSTSRSRMKKAIPRRLLKLNSVRFIHRVVLSIDQQELIGGNGENVLASSIGAYAASVVEQEKNSGRISPQRTAAQHSTLDLFILFCTEADSVIDAALKNSFLPLLSRIEAPSFLMPLFSTIHTVIEDRYAHKKLAETLSTSQMHQISNVLRMLSALPTTALLDSKSFVFSGVIMQILLLAADDSAVLDENFVQIYCALIDLLAEKPLLQSVSSVVDDEANEASASAAQHTLLMQTLRILAHHENLQLPNSRKIYSHTVNWLTASRNADSGRRRRLDTALAVRVVDELVASLSSAVEEVTINNTSPDDEVRRILLGRPISDGNGPKNDDPPAVQWRMLVILLQSLVVSTPKKSASLRLLLEPLCRAMRLLAALLPSILPTMNAAPVEEPAKNNETDVDGAVENDAEAKLERDFLLSLGNCLRMLTVVLRQLKKSDNTTFPVDLLPVNEVMRCIERVKHAGIVRLALSLLTHIADRAPLNVLHQSMTLFAFMGSHMAHKEDEWSLSVLTSTLRCLIPTLMRSCCADDAEHEPDDQKSTKRLTLAVKIISTFLDALPHFAPHYVQPVLNAIVKALGKKQHLWLFTAMLLRTYVQHQCAMSDDEIESSRGFQIKWAPAFPFMLEQFYVSNDAASSIYNDAKTDESSSVADTTTEDESADVVVVESRSNANISRTTPSDNNNTWQPVRAADSLIASPQNNSFSSKKRSADDVDDDDMLQAYAADNETHDNQLSAADLLYNMQQLVELAMQLPSSDMISSPADNAQQPAKSAKLPKFLRTAFGTSFFANHNNTNNSGGRRRWRDNTNVIEYDHDSLEIMQMNRLRLSLMQFVGLLVSTRTVWRDKSLSSLSHEEKTADDERKRLKSNMSALLFTLNRAQVFAREQASAIAVQLENETQQEPATTTDEEEPDGSEIARPATKKRRQRNSESIRSYQEHSVTLFYEIYETSVDYWKSLFGGAVHRTTTTLLGIIPAKFFVRIAIGFLKGSVLSVIRQQTEVGSLDAVENALHLITESLVLRGGGQNNEISTLSDDAEQYESTEDDKLSYVKLISVFLDIVRDQNFAETGKTGGKSSSFTFPASCKAAAVAGLARLCRIVAAVPVRTIKLSAENDLDSQNSAVLMIIDSLADEMTKIFNKIRKTTNNTEQNNNNAENEKLDNVVLLHALLDAVLLLAHKMQTQYLKLIHTTAQLVLEFLLNDAENNPLLIASSEDGAAKFSFGTTYKALQKLVKRNPWQLRKTDDGTSQYRHYTQSLRAALQFLTLHVGSFPQFLSTRALGQTVQLCWKFQYAVKLTKSASSSARINGRHEVEKLSTTLFAAVDAGTIGFRPVFKVFSNMQRNGEFQQALSDLPKSGSESSGDELVVFTLPLSLLAAAIKKCQTKELFSAATDVAQLLFSLLTLCSNHEINLMPNKNLADEVETDRMLHVSTHYAPLFDVMLSFSMSISPLMFQHLISRTTTWTSAENDADANSILIRHLFALNATARFSAELRSAFVHLATPVLELIMSLLQDETTKAETAAKNTKNLINLKTLNPLMRMALMQPLYDTLHNMISNDRQEFFDKMRVEALMKCVFAPFRQFSKSTNADIRQHLRRLSIDHVGPMLVALGSGSASHYRDVYIRDLNEQLCELASEHSSSAIRECSLRIMLALMQSSFGIEFQTLLPDTAQALHQVMEDDDADVLKVCNDLLKQAEKINGEPISDLMS